MVTRCIRLCASPLAAAETTALGWVAEALGELGVALNPEAPAAAPTLTLCTDPALGHAEAFALAPGPAGLTLAAGGPPGLLYGLAELAARLRLAPPEAEPLAAVPAVTARPRHAVRSQALYLHHQRCEAEWFHDPAFWEEYCALLARSRYNRFSLVYGHQTAYLSPPWPYLVAVPGYEHVQPTGFTPDDRARHLATLRLIVAACTRWRLAFTLGVWQQFAGEYPANGVPALGYDETFAYAPRGLAAVLAACPDIRGVQFRMNSEAGIHEEHQERFFSGLFAVLRDHPGLDWLDLRAKGLRAETIDAAERLGLPVTVSTKFWCEHTGQPTFATRVNPSDDAQYRRYGYWDLLRRDRRYRLLYRLWNVGTNRVLLWGDPAWARRFAQSCHTGDAQGAETMAPLTNLGYGNRGPAWHVLPDPAHRYTRAELLRYWPLVMNLGLALYQDAADQPVLTAEYARRLGPAGPGVQAAMAAAGPILPSLTACRSESASTFGYWPELSPGGLLDAYPGIATGDVARYRRADEELDAQLADRPDPRAGPDALAALLRHRAAETAAICPLPSVVCPPSAELLAFQRDLAVQVRLARYHALRLDGAGAWLRFRRCASRPDLHAAAASYHAALAEWGALVALTAGVFQPHLVFNRAERQVGHWQDELPFLRHDAARLAELLPLFDAALADPQRWLAAAPAEPGWGTLERIVTISPEGVVSHGLGGMLPAEAPAYPLYGLPPLNLTQTPAATVRDVLAPHLAAGLGHCPPRRAPAGQPIRLTVTLLGAATPVTLHWRAGDGPWQTLTATPVAPFTLTATLPPQPPGTTLWYAFTTAAGHGTPTAPHRLFVTDPAWRPALTVAAPETWPVGKDLPVTLHLASPGGVRAAWLYYRRQHQAEDWLAIALPPAAGPATATIPGPYLDGSYDVQLTAAVVDHAGTATWWPDPASHDPLHLIRLTQ